MMYHDMVGQMQKNLSNYMESNMQGSTQKKINRPSDDPVGMYRVLTTRNDISATEQYEENAKTALGWLQLSDNVLATQVPVTITSLKTLAEQASTGSLTPENRLEIAYQVRELFGQLLNLANTRFEGKTIYAGHEYTESAFEMGLAVTCWDAVSGDPPDKDWQTFDGYTPPRYGITGASDKSIVIQFTDSGRVGADALKYRWSKDGGQTWPGGSTLPAGSPPHVLEADGVRIELPHVGGQGQKVTAADTDLGPGARNGTMLYVRPTAIYQGDDKDLPPRITVMGSAGTLAANQAEASGTFHHDVLVRVDDGTTNPPEVIYSYSTDGGSNWTTARTQPVAAPPPAPAMRFTVPGGYLDTDVLPQNGTQILIHPDRADLDYEIMRDTYIPVNAVGKDIFGGYYQGEPALNNGGDLSANLFEVVGNFIAYLENDNQEGCQRTLAALTTAEKTILKEAARVGGMENRVEMARDVLSYQKIDQQEQLSYTEDIDLTELLTKLTQQQLAYSTVLKSSSMIMQLSLANYV
jgi:flagellar hook-associated protein 3 FlgL